MKSKSILLLVATSEDTIFIFTGYEKFYSQLTFLPKRVIMTDTCQKLCQGPLKFRDRTADITYKANVTLFLHAMSGRLPLTAAFSRCKLLFHPILYPLNTAITRPN